MKTISQLIHSCFAAYETKDRAALEGLLADDFTFSSPLDDHINRTRYFERCWPNSENLKAFHIEKMFEDGNEAFVTYEAEATDGSRFRNTEFFTANDAGQLSHVHVYFGSEPDEAAEITAIRQVIEAWAEAIRGKNVEGVLRHFADESVRYYLAPPLKTTLPIRENLEGWFGTFDGPIGYEIRDLSIQTSGDLALAHSLNHLTGTKTDGEKADLWFRETMGFRSVNGKWRIVHEHESVPFSMDGTFKAAIDLKP